MSGKDLPWSGEHPTPGRRKPLRPGGALLAAFPAPAIHTVAGSSNYWDDVLSFGLIGGAVLVLVAMNVLGGRRRNKATSRHKRSGRHQ